MVEIILSLLILAAIVDMQISIKRGFRQLNAELRAIRSELHDDAGA